MCLINRVSNKGESGGPCAQRSANGSGTLALVDRCDTGIFFSASEHE